MKYFLIFALFFVLLISCLKTQTTESAQDTEPINEITFFKTIPTESFMTIVNDNINNPDYVLIDVRTPSEFQSGHIKNALLIDFNSSNFNTIIESLDRSKTYMLYCRSGNRSGQAMEIMKNKGFTGIYNMQSGFNEYQNLGYPVEKN